MNRGLFTKWVLLPALAATAGQAFSADEATPPAPSHAYSIEGSAASSSRVSPELVEEFTAHTLGRGEVQLGTDLDVGITDYLDLGTDVVSGVLGVPSLKLKATFYNGDDHKIAFGLRAAYLTRDTLLWGGVKDHFDKLEARVVRPAISWTHKLSPRLSLHSFWAKGFGPIEVELSEKGRRKLWETKHPDADYDSRDEETQAPTEAEPNDEADDATGDAGDADDDDETIADVKSEANQESTESSSLHNQSAQVQSITGLAQDRFQLTGEYVRINGNKVLITTRIEQTTIEELKSNFLRLTVAHHWVWDSFQMRLGVGAQYFAISGEDLDGEQIDKTDVEPASDISFYWRF